MGFAGEAPLPKDLLCIVKMAFLFLFWSSDDTGAENLDTYREKEIPEFSPPGRKYGQRSEGTFLDVSLCAQACTHIHEHAHIHTTCQQMNTCLYSCIHSSPFTHTCAQKHVHMCSHTYGYPRVCAHVHEDICANAHRYTGPRLG